jgi:hypothetical protein
MENTRIPAEVAASLAETWAVRRSQVSSVGLPPDVGELSQELAEWRSHITYPVIEGDVIPEPCSGCSFDY